MRLLRCGIGGNQMINGEKHKTVKEKLEAKEELYEYYMRDIYSDCENCIYNRHNIKLHK